MALVFNPFTGNFDNVMASSSDMSFSGGSLNVNGDLTLDSGGAFTTTVQAVTPTANRTISFPDQTGTVGLVSGATGNIQYNNAGQLAGSADLTVGNFNWTDPTATYTGLKFNVTETGSANASRLLDIQRNGGTVFSVDKNAGARASTFYTEENSTNGIIIGNYAGRGIRLARDTSITFHVTSPTTTADVGIKRDSAGVVAVTDGSTGTGYLKQTPVAIINLPAMPNAAYDGARGFINDATSITFGGNVSGLGGGSLRSPVYSDGTNWYFG